MDDAVIVDDIRFKCGACGGDHAAMDLHEGRDGPAQEGLRPKSAALPRHLRVHARVRDLSLHARSGGAPMTKRLCEACKDGSRPIKNKARYCDACAQMPLPFQRGLQRRKKTGDVVRKTVRSPSRTP